MTTQPHRPADSIAAHEREADNSAALLSISTIPAAEPCADIHEDLFTKIQRAKQEWEVTVDSLSELVCLLDAQGCVMRANRVIEAWGLGRVQAVKGLSLHQLLHPRCTIAACALYRSLEQAEQAARQERAIEVEVYDATLERHLRIQVGPVLESTRVTLCMAVVVIEDISERKRAEDAVFRYTERLKTLNELQEAILAARSPEAIVRVALLRIQRLVNFHQARVLIRDADDDGCLIFTADADGETGLRPETSLPSELYLSSEGRWPERSSIVADLQRVSNPSYLEQQLLAEGLRSFISVPLRAEGDFIGMLYFGSRRLAAFEQEHTRIAQELADLLAIAVRQARLHRKLQRTNAELEEAVKARDEMLQNVSHELRTPLGLMKGYVEILLEGLMGPLNQEQWDAIEVIRHQSERLRYLLDQLLAFKIIDVKTLHVMPLALDSFLGKIVEARKIPAARQKISLHLEVAPDLLEVAADPELLSHVVHNLLDNAVKFSPEGGSVIVRACLAGDRHRITVADRGIGIPADKLERVFERFYQVSQGMHRSYGGMGIGLALCREIVQAHGGSIWAESDGPGKGATLYVELPLSTDG